MTTTIPTTISDGLPSAKELCLFLADYSAALLGAGATCIRIEKNVSRIARAYGMEAEMTIMPRHVQMAVWEIDRHECATASAAVRKSGISFNINTLLSQLSWEVSDRRISFGEARRRYGSIIGGDRQSKWLVLILVTLANASFCRLFGGDAAAMAIVGAATLCGYYLKQIMLGRGCDVRLVVLACSFVSSVLGATDMLFSVGTTPEIALGTSVLYLVPGIPFLNSFSDLLYSHYICAFSRFADALVLTACLSAGLCAGMLLMNVGMF